MPSLLAIKDLTVSIDGKRLLSDLSFSLNEGDFLSVVGPNGAGKTTLLKSIARLIPSMGVISLNERDIRSISRKNLASMLAYVPQRFNTPKGVSVEDFLTMSRFPFLSRFERYGATDLAFVERALTLTNIHTLKEKPLSVLSGGELQKVLIAGALAQDPKLLLLDEPTSHLDPKQGSEIRSLLKDLQRELNLTIISVSHDVNGAFYNATKVLGLRRGASVFYGSPHEFMNTTVLNSLYGEQFLLFPHPETQVPVAITQ